MRRFTLLCGLSMILGAAAPATAVTIDTERVVGGLPDLLGIETAGDGSGRLFLVLQGGQILIYDGAQLLPFLNIGPRVLTGTE